MSFMNKWRDFQRKNVISESKSIAKKATEETLISEIDLASLSKISDFLGDIPSDKLSFGEAFDGKKRVAFAMPHINDVNTDIGRLLAFFENASAEPNFADSTVSQQVKSEKSDKVQIRKTRIGKWLNKAVTMRGKQEETRKKYINSTKGSNTDVKKSYELSDSYNKLRLRNAKEFGGNFSSYSENELKSMANFWKKKADYYRQNPNALEEEQGGFTIIVSRAPIDVLRMSDFDNIQSCHSVSGGYFQCAVSEAKGQGIVAYVVENEQLKFMEKAGLELQDDEIFVDRQRGIKGISPKSRIRLRKFTFSNPLTGEQDEMAVPEMAVYGRRIPGFANSILDWALEAQPNVKELSEKSEYPVFNSFERWGGSYSDNPDGEILNRILTHGTANRAPYDSYSSVVIMGAETENDFTAETEELEVRANGFKHIVCSATADEEGVEFYGGIDIELSDTILGDDFDVRESDLHPVVIELYNNFAYLEPVEALLMPGDNGVVIRIMAENGDLDTNIDGFGEFVDDLELLSEAYDEIKAIVIRTLIDEEMIPKSEWANYASEIEQDAVKSFENLSINADDTEISILTKDGHEHAIDISEYTRLLVKTMDLGAINTFGGVMTNLIVATDKAAKEIFVMLKSHPTLNKDAGNKILEAGRIQTKNQLSLPGTVEDLVDDMFLPEFFSVSYATKRIKGKYFLIVGLAIDIKLEITKKELLISKEFADWLDKNYYKAMKSVEKVIKEIILNEFKENKKLSKVIKKGMSESRDKLPKKKLLRRKSIIVKINRGNYSG